MATRADPSFVAQSKAYLRLRRYWRAAPVAYVHQRFGIEPTW
jgi:hypothetical protein